MEPTTSAIELVVRAQAGDREACDALVPLYEREVESAVIRYLAPSRPHDIDDAAQDIWLKVFERFDRFDPTRGVKFSTWLYALARNHCFDLLKKRRVRTRSMSVVSADGEDATLEPESTDTLLPHDAVARREEVDRYRFVADALLTREQRTVFEMRAMRGLEFTEIAILRRMPLGTAKTIYYRTVERLREQLDETPRAA